MLVFRGFEERISLKESTNKASVPIKKLVERKVHLLSLRPYGSKDFEIAIANAAFLVCYGECVRGLFLILK